MRRPAAPGQCARHAVEHGRLPDQAEACRAGAHLFRTIPGLENAEFARLGGLHRNTFIQARPNCSTDAAAEGAPNIRFAGQITGCEGYVESAAIGLLADCFAAAELAGGPCLRHRRRDRARRAARPHHRRADAETYQPMNVNFGLFPPAGLPLSRPCHQTSPAVTISNAAMDPPRKRPIDHPPMKAKL
jgi:folate-dependent tRNA-U54 methylase TrmFO/GidA